MTWLVKDMKNRWLAILLIGTLICCGLAVAVQPVKEPVDKLVLIHYKNNANSKFVPATDQATFYKLLGVKWKTSSAVNYYVNSKDQSDIDAIQAAFSTWDDNTGANLFWYNGSTETNTATLDNTNTVFWGPIPNRNVIAVTTIWYTRQTKQIVDADIEMNSNLPWSNSGASGAFDIQDIATHEAGHVCGLGDLYNAPASELTMYGYSSTGETKKDSLGAGDVLGIHVLYGI
jgi:hypothetical protein